MENVKASMSNLVLSDSINCASRHVIATAKQTQIMVGLLDSMNLPISIYFSLCHGISNRYEIHICYESFHASLVQWFLEEVLRREARITF